MKMIGSTLKDSLFGTDGVDEIHGGGGNDLISAWYKGNVGAADKIYAEAGDDLISGFSFNLDKLNRSASRGAMIDGGTGTDVAILQMQFTGASTMLSKLSSVITVRNVEEVIYEFGNLTEKQRVSGTDGGETVYLGESGGQLFGMAGNDYLFSGSGDDKLVGGLGDDFLSGAGGHNTLTGGTGSDMFMFHLTEDYTYSNITDFQKGVDKIALILDTGTNYSPNNSYGDGLRKLNHAIGTYPYMDYDHGRYFGREDFKSDASAGTTYYTDLVKYEQSTGSFLYHVILDDGNAGNLEYDVLLAHVEGNPNLDASDFVFMVI